MFPSSATARRQRAPASRGRTGPVSLTLLCARPRHANAVATAEAISRAPEDVGEALSSASADDCDDTDERYGSIEEDSDCDGLPNDLDPDNTVMDGDLDGIPYDQDCDDFEPNVSQYDENGECTLAICIVEQEETLLSTISKSNIIYGEATITLTSYEGWEQHQFAEGLELTRHMELMPPSEHLCTFMQASIQKGRRGPMPAIASI